MRRLYRDGALADGRSDRLRLGVSILVEDGRVTWIRPSDDEGPLVDPGGVEIVDASGSTIVPGLVDAHSHLTMPGGAHWIDRASDPTETLLEAAEANARLLTRAGVRWARDVGSVTRPDPEDGGRARAVAIRVRERWRGRPGYPHVRAAGTWIMAKGLLPALSVEVANADELLARGDGPAGRRRGPRQALPRRPRPGRQPMDGGRASAGRGGRPRASLPGDRPQRIPGRGARRCRGRRGLPSSTASSWTTRRRSLMAANGVRLVSTLCVLASWRSFGRTTAIPRFASDEGRAKVEARRERAMASVRIAHRAGVSIATGTDFGGGSTRANQLAWEVEQLVEAGLEPWEALASATWRGGELLGEPDAGVIREGGPGDLVLVHGDPCRTRPRCGGPGT